jgi:hypothetical protein
MQSVRPALSRSSSAIRSSMRALHRRDSTDQSPRVGARPPGNCASSAAISSSVRPTRCANTMKAIRRSTGRRKRRSDLDPHRSAAPRRQPRCAATPRQWSTVPPWRKQSTPATGRDVGALRGAVACRRPVAQQAACPLQSLTWLHLVTHTVTSCSQARLTSGGGPSTAGALRPARPAALPLAASLRLTSS